jgi:DNA-binding PadR family transcriptional regulator
MPGMPKGMNDARTSPPLKPADFHILLALLEGPRHGYEIMKEVERESEGTVRLEVGTLYRLLARLLEAGWLAEAEEDGRRRNYRLTRLGRRTLRAEAERLALVVDRLRLRKLLPQSDI